MENLDCGLLTIEGHNCISLGFQCWVDVDVTHVLTSIRDLRASYPSINLLIVHSVEVDWLLEPKSRHRLVIDILRPEI